MFTLAGAGSHLSRKKSYSSVDFPSLWATGLGRSGIGPEAGGGGWEVGRGGSYGGGAAATCETQVSRCSARRASTALVLPAGDSTSSFTPAGWTFQESKGELLHCWLAQNYFPSMLH